jgi:predicted AlkP superfamily phosphohydrolase/phosphomutase
MKKIVLLLLVVIVPLAWWFGAFGGRKPTRKPARTAKQKVFVMGFDGMDPTLARRFMDEGKLPNLKKLADGGTFATLQTAQPSESPVAWASFMTGVNPGKHNVYDFLVRDFDTYLPAPGGVKATPPDFLWGLIPMGKPKVETTRGGTSFWVHAGFDGIRSVVLTVPGTFPPEEIEHGSMMAGLGVPDIRNTNGTFYYWATDLTSFEEASSEFGGYLKRLSFEDGQAKTYLRGPENPVLRKERVALVNKEAKGEISEREAARLAEIKKIKDVDLDVTVRWKRGQEQAEVTLAGVKHTLKVGQWTEWIPLKFKLNAFISVHGITQLYLVRADEELQLYAHPVNWDPRRPPIPITKPDAYSAELAQDLGLYRTLGWAESSWMPLNEGRIDEATFLHDCEQAFLDRERIIFKSLEKKEWDLFVAVIETTDRISHMMWRLIDPKHPMYDEALAAKYGDSIEKVYRRADDLAGRIQAKLPPGTTFIVMSDHGFHSFRRSVNLNTWLCKNGYMSCGQEESGQKTLEDLFGRTGNFWQDVDWSKTKAYAVGLGPIYINLRGRERQGIVSAGAEYKALQDEIASKLATLVDPEDNTPIFGAMYKRDEIYSGDYLANAPDIVAGFNDGYRVGWQDTLGAIRRTVVENNNRKWSGDHCATVQALSGGVFFSNRKIEREPHIMDLGPTVLKLLEVPLPSGLDGKPLL